jgi:hypothetical protein
MVVISFDEGNYVTLFLISQTTDFGALGVIYNRAKPGNQSPNHPGSKDPEFPDEDHGISPKEEGQ